MAERLNKPGNRSVATIDSKKNKWFKQMQQLGHIPTTYASLDDLTNYVIQLKNEGKTSAQISEATGADYRNVISNPMFQPSISSSGSLRGMDMRAAREDIKPDEQLYLKERFGDDFLKDFRRLRELEWGNKKPAKGENIEALRERVFSAMERTPSTPNGGVYSRSPSSPNFESAKTQANRTRDMLRSSFGNGGRTSEVDRGHGFAAMETTIDDPDIPGVKIRVGGAGVSAENLVDEIGFLNRGHGSDPTFDPRVLKALNMSDGDLQAAYDAYMTHRGLNINPVRYSGNYLAANEGLRELKQDSNPLTPQLTAPKDPARVSQDSIEARDRWFEDQAQQRAAENSEVARVRAVELNRSGMSPKDSLDQAEREVLAEARDHYQKLALKQSTLGDTTQTTGGPVRIVQEASRPSNARRAENTRLTAQADAARKKALLQKYATDLGQASSTELPVNAPTLPNKIPAIGKAAAVLGGVPILFDAADAFAGTQGAVQANTPGQRLASGLQAVSGYTGLASLNPGFAPVTGPVSLATGALSAAVQRREDMNKPPVRHTYTGPTPQIIPTPIPRSKPIGNGQGGITKPRGSSVKSGQPLLSQNNLKWALKQLGFLR